jgi:hypothetical protein
MLLNDAIVNLGETKVKTFGSIGGVRAFEEEYRRIRDVARDHLLSLIRRLNITNIGS